jgi:prephenate dehydrogenase
MKTINVGIIGGTKGMGQWFAGLLQKENCTVHICGRKTLLRINEMDKI